MGLQIPIGYLQASQQFLLNGAAHPFMVVTGHRWVGSGETADEQAQAVRAGWLEYWSMGTRPTAWTLGVCRVLKRTAGDTLVAGEDSAIDVGTDAAGDFGLMANSALLVRKRTGLAGSRHRGRMFVPGFSINENTITAAGYLTGTVQSVHQAVFDTMLASWLAADVELVILHSEEDSDGVPITDEPTPVIALAVQGQVASQRTRMRP